MSIADVQKDLRKHASPQKKAIATMFFKTGAGHYGAGDVFLGVTVPETRIVAKKYTSLSLLDIQKLLYSKIHEERLCSLMILTEKYQRASVADQKKIFDFYIKHSKQVNNWDLVDASAHKIAGAYLLNKPRKILYRFAISNNLWQKRIAIIATLAFIREKEYTDTRKIAELLLNDKHDLIHKAVGWMLREVGNRSLLDEEVFLKKYYKKMPRTMLRYAIEKFPEKKRLMYLKGTKK